MANSRPPARRRQAELRWSVAADVLKAYRSEPESSRAELTKRLHLSSGTMTDLVNRLQAARLIEETAAAPSGRGRPSTRLLPHPKGPLVLAADITASGWRTASAGVDGVLVAGDSSDHTSYSPDQILNEVGNSLNALHTQLGRRVVATSVAIAGTLSGTTVIQSSVLDWHHVDLAGLATGTVPLLCTNDATAAAVAEARVGAARGAKVSAHLMVLSGTGGGLVRDGAPLLGAIGAGAEYGHLPIGERQLRCSCGAIGCWDVDLGARSLARDLGLTLSSPALEVKAATAWLDDQDPARAAAEVIAQARSLGRGLAGLVNALDPEVVTISGLAPTLRRLAPHSYADAFDAALMSFRRDAPPPVLDATVGEDGALIGAIELALDQLICPSGLANWAEAESALD